MIDTTERGRRRHGASVSGAHPLGHAHIASNKMAFRDEPNTPKMSHVKPYAKTNVSLHCSVQNWVDLCKLTVSLEKESYTISRKKNIANYDRLREIRHIFSVKIYFDASLITPTLELTHLQVWGRSLASLRRCSRSRYTHRNSIWRRTYVNRISMKWTWKEQFKMNLKNERLKTRPRAASSNLVRSSNERATSFANHFDA